jgi:HSP20 family protein
MWEREVDRLFDSFRRRWGFPSFWGRELRLPTPDIGLQVPSIDVFEQGDEIVVKAELPGLSKDDIDLTVSGSSLTLKGEKSKKEEVKEEDYYYCERSFGSFSRTIDLPCEVKVDAAKASFTSGVLEVRLPKTEEAKRKSTKIAVQ